MSQRYIRELCVGHCYAWIWTSVYNSHGGLSLYLHASANLDTYILNLHAQSRATVCTLHGNMYSSSMCAQFHGTFKYCYFFEQVFSTKMAINLGFWEFNDENECKLKPVTRATFCNFSHWNWSCGSEVMLFWMRHVAFCQNTLKSCICTQNGHHCDLRKNTQFKIFLAESVSTQTKRASVNTTKDIIFCFWAV